MFPVSSNRRELQKVSDDDDDEQKQKSAQSYIPPGNWYFITRLFRGPTNLPGNLFVRNPNKFGSSMAWGCAESGWSGLSDGP